MKVETHLPLGKVDPGLRAPEARLDLSGVFAEARMLDEMDYDGMVLTETKEDPFMVLTIAAQATERISLTTAVALAFPRSPTVTALSAWTLQRHSGGRFILGLGTQVKGHVQRRYGVAWSAPGPWMREYVQAVRAVWDCWQNGTPLDFHGAHYDLTLMVPLFDPGPIAHPRISRSLGRGQSVHVPRRRRSGRRPAPASDLHPRLHPRRHAARGPLGRNTDRPHPGGR